MRAPARLLSALLVAVTAVLAGPGQAQAADGYRYWSFWQRDGGKWSYATQGPSTLRPEDGDVLGFRFAVSEDSKNAASPREQPDFASVCEADARKKGEHVAVVVDFGTRTDAPAGGTPPSARNACAPLGSGDTAADALAAVAKPLRYDSGAMLCGIAGYPEKGCGEQVSETAGSSAGPAPEKSGGLPVAVQVGAGVALVAVLAAGGYWQARRRR